MNNRDEKGRAVAGKPSLNPKGRGKNSKKDIRTEFKDLKTILIERNFDPREALVELATSNSESIRLKAIDIMMSRLEPSLKQTTHVGEVTLKHDTDLIKEHMKQLIDQNTSEY